jgi:hypothetical protein
MVVCGFEWSTAAVLFHRSALGNRQAIPFNFAPPEFWNISVAGRRLRVLESVISRARVPPVYISTVMWPLQYVVLGRQ